MQILKKTHEVLVIQADSSFMRVGTFFGASFFLSGLSIILFGANLETLNCYRVKPTQVTCQHSSLSLLGKDINTIERLQGAEVKVETDSNGGTYQVVILTADGKKSRLSGSYDAAQTVTKINDFIGNLEEPSLEIQDYGGDTFKFGAIFMLVGVGFIPLSLKLSKTPKLCLFDKSSGQVHLKYKNILFQSHVREERLNDVKNLEVNETHINFNEAEVYEIKLMLKSGD